MIVAWINRVLGWDHVNGDAGGARREPPPSPTGAEAHWLFASNELAAELARTRRYEHDLSIVVLSVSAVPDDVVRTPDRLTRLPHVVFLLTSGALRGMLRQSDIVYYQPAEERFVIALAEADAEQAGHAVLRVGSLFRTRFSLAVAAGVAAFPYDGLTLPDLVAKAVERTQLAASSDAGKESLALVTTHSDVEAWRAG